MLSTTPMVSPSKKMLWTGRILSGAVVVFMLMDGVMHLTRIDPVVQAFAQLGFPLTLAVGLAIVELVSTLLYLYPRTSILGAILLTAYLGGAVATHLRVGSPLFGETLFPVYVGILLWGGIYLREPRLHVLLPLTGTPVRRGQASNLSAGQAAVAPQH